MSLPVQQVGHTGSCACWKAAWQRLSPISRNRSRRTRNQSKYLEDYLNKVHGLRQNQATVYVDLMDTTQQIMKIAVKQLMVKPGEVLEGSAS